MRVSGLGNWKKDEFGVKRIVFLAFVSKIKRKNGMNEVGFRFHELSLGQVKALDCGNSLGPILAKNSRKTEEKTTNWGFPFLRLVISRGLNHGFSAWPKKT